MVSNVIPMSVSSFPSVKEDAAVVMFDKEVDSLISQIRQKIAEEAKVHPYLRNPTGASMIAKAIYFGNMGCDHKIYDEILLSHQPLLQSYETRIRNAAKEAFSFLQSGRKITLLTGGSSIALINAAQVARVPLLGGQPAFLPSGTSLLHNIAPFAGTLDEGIAINGINQFALSFVNHQYWRTAAEYAESGRRNVFKREDELKILLDEICNLVASGSISRIKIAVIRLMQLGNITEAEKNAVKERLDKEIAKLPESSLMSQWERYACLIGLEASMKLQSTEITATTRLQRGQIVVMREYNIRYPNGPSDNYFFGMISDYFSHFPKLRFLCLNGQRKMTALSNIRLVETKELDEMASKLPSPSLEDLCAIEKRIQGPKNELREIRALLDTMTPLILNVEQQKLLSDPFPIMWGTTTVRRAFQVTSGEVGVCGKMVIGRDLQVAFTDHPNVKRLQEIVSPFGVHVMSFDAATFILERRRHETPQLEYF